MKEKALLSFSGGKDSCLALHKILQSNTFQIVALLTTLSSESQKTFMNAVRLTLLKQQAKSLNFPLETIFVSNSDTSAQYESKMQNVLEKYKSKGINLVIHGDIFLEDLKRYRQKKLAKIDINTLFPLWQNNTKKLAYQFINLGFKAVITSIDNTILDKSFLGREFDRNLLYQLPPHIDPCGENGEFHTFVYDGPIFKSKIMFKKTPEHIQMENFCFCDLLTIENTNKT